VAHHHEHRTSLVDGLRRVPGVPQGPPQGATSVARVDPSPVGNGIDWDVVVPQIASRGWARLTGAVAPDALVALEHAAPGPWSSLPDTEGGAGVRQAGLACHGAVDAAGDVVAALADGIRAGIDGAGAADVAPLPVFNHAEWCRSERGRKYITAHRDPDTAGGVIAILTIRGQATFRVWEFDGPLPEARRRPEVATAWETGDGDLVLLRGGGWPRPASRCPVHEAESPPDGDRVTLTLRHNKGGYGAAYFG
jgi:hypothetical protein